MKRTIFHLGLVCLAVISPFSLVFGEAALSAGDSVVYDLAAIFRMADEERPDKSVGGCSACS